jgi:hypothetical protein
MREQPQPTEREQELAATERQQEEDAMRYPGHEAPAAQPSVRESEPGEVPPATDRDAKPDDPNGDA